MSFSAGKSPRTQAFTLPTALATAPETKTHLTVPTPEVVPTVGPSPRTIIGYPPFATETKCTVEQVAFPPQHQDVQPGLEYLMNPLPIFDNPKYKSADKLKGKVALVTGGDSGIGRAVATIFAKEGALIVIAYLYEDRDALDTKNVIEKYGSRCLLLRVDLRNESSCGQIITEVIKAFGRLDVLVMNHGVQFPQQSISDISTDQLMNTFTTNILSYFHIAKAAIPHLKAGSTIISTTSVTAYKGAPMLLDYASTKGALISFTRSLSLQLAPIGVRVNAVAPGPIWTPLTVSSFDADTVSHFGQNVPFGRAGQPFELAPTYVYLACDDSSYVSGQVLHVNGGIITST